MIGRIRMDAAAWWIAPTLVCLGLLHPGCGSDDSAGDEAVDAGVPSDTVPPDDGATNAPDTGPNPPDVGPEPPDAPADAADVDAGPPLSIDVVSPGLGHPKGGETVAVKGLGFDPDCQVLFDGSYGTNIVFVNEERLHVTTPPHPAGAVKVTVITGDGRVASLDDAYLYYNEVQVDAVTPNQGPREGGTPVTVTGSGFTEHSLVIFGEHKALAVQVVDNHTIIALTPPGATGPADVIVANALGLNRKKNGFRYQSGATIDLVVPAAGPVDGGQSVELRGDGFSPPLQVWFGSIPASTVQPVTSSRAIAKAPPGVTGVVDVRLDGQDGTAVLKSGYLYHDLPAGAPFQILHTSPANGPLAGGTTVAITATSMGEADVTSATFAGQPAEVLEVDEDAATVVVLVPPGSAPGAVDIAVKTTGGEGTAVDAFTYVEPLVLTSVSPAEGPAEGGTALAISGSGFGPSPTVFVGALMASAVTVGPAGLGAIAPPGSPGLADVRVVDGGRVAVLEDAYTFKPENHELYVVVPGHGAIAGGTWVQIIGAGLPDNPKVAFDGVEAADVVTQSPGLITARTPPGEVGTVSVSVTGFTHNAVLTNAFTYFDPKTTFGGTWGDSLDLQLNVTVIDGTDATAVMDAFVIVDGDPATPYQGFTNAAGQITFGGPDLTGAHTISISKEGYVTYSVVAFDAENVTVFLQRTDQAQANLDSVAPAVVQGKVSGLGKYTAGVAGECKPGLGTDPAHCQVCAAGEADACGESGAICAPLGGSDTWHCLMACGGDADCPDKTVCQPLSGGDHCVPSPGPKVAVCIGSKPYFRMFDIPLGPGAMTDEDGVFTIIAFPTEVAIVCFGGLWLGDGEPDSKTLENAIKGNPSGTFKPIVMGVKRHLFLKPGAAEAGLEITLDIPLSRKVHARMEKPPIEDTDYLWAEAYLDFGSDGVVRLPVVRFLYADEPFILDAIPSKLGGDIADASFTFYAGARSYTNSLGYNYPRAYVVRQHVTEPQDGRMLRMVEGTWTTQPTTLTQSLLASHDFGAKDVIAVGTGGSIYKYDGAQHKVMPVDTKKTLRGVHGLAPDDVWAVGDAGTVVHFTGASWQTIDVPTNAELRAVYAEADGTVRVAGHQVALRKDPSGQWHDESSPMGSWWDIDETSPSDVWVVGRDGMVRHYDGAGWSLLPTPTDGELRAVAAVAKDDVWMAGEGGVIIHFDGDDFQLQAPLTNHTLNDLDHRGPNEVVAVGSEGTVLSWDGGGWVTVPVGDYTQDLFGIALPESTSAAYTFGDHQLVLGPIVAPAHMQVPEPGGLLETDALEWIADDRVAPHYQVVEILVPGPMGPILIWELIVAGDVTVADLPNLPALSGTPGLMEGPHRLRITRVYQEGFDIDEFDYTDLGSLDRQSWAVEYMPFETPSAEP